MSYSMHSRSGGAALLITALLCATATASEDPAASFARDSLSIEWPELAASAELVVARPDGTQSVLSLPEGQALSAGLFDELPLEDGVHHYEIRFSPQVDEDRQAELNAIRLENVETTTDVDFSATQSGSFRVIDGELTIPAKTQSTPRLTDSGSRDNVILDDLVVTGGGCFGMDCADGEDFNFATVKINNNNPRLNFIDSSASSSFPDGDWQLRANDSDNGGANHFSIDWLGTGADTGASPVTTPFRVDGDAPTNALRVTNIGRVGLGTATPATHLQLTDGNTPTVRLDQNTTDGFTAQVWDVAGNEANFFIRDVTNGSLLPFRIRPGAPDSSIDIQSSGNVGIGTDTPAAKLHVADGDVRVDGSVYQLSSRALKTDFVQVDPTRLLDLVGELDLGIWRYLSSSDAAAHFGPAAEDFHSAFGLGSNEESISIADMAGVALGAAQALKVELDARDAHIADLEARLARLERALEVQLQQDGR